MGISTKEIRDNITVNKPKNMDKGASSSASLDASSYDSNSYSGMNRTNKNT